MSNDLSSETFTVTDLKQFACCPRIFYYQACLPDIRPLTDKMALGMEAHRSEHQRSARRTMALPELGMRETVSERRFNVPLFSPALGLSGQVDELLLVNGEYIPVDYKFARSAGPHVRMQLAAYALLIEERFETRVKRGIIYLIRGRKSVEVKITPALRQKVRQTLRQMQQIARSQQMPPPTEQRNRCLECEFRRFCNDV